MLKLFRGTTLQRYILREFVVIFGLAFVSCTAVFLFASLFQVHNEYGETALFLVLLPMLLPKMIGWAIPMATLIATTLVFSRLSAEDEVLAAQAGGAPLRVLTLPIYVSGLILSAYCLWNNQGGQAIGNSLVRNQVLNINDPKKFFDTLNRPGTSLPIPMENGGIYHINLLPLVTDPVTHAVHRPIHIAIFQNQQVSLTVIAGDFQYEVFARDRENFLRLTLHDAQRLGESPSYSDQLTIEIPQPPIDSMIDIGKSRGQLGWLTNYDESVSIHRTLPRRHAFLLERAADFTANVVGGGYSEPSTVFLDAGGWSDTRIASEAIYASGGALDREHGDIVECWRKIAMSVLPFSMAILGVGLGLLVKKSQRILGLMFSLLIYALVYYPMMLVGKELANAGKMGLIALWLPNIVLFIAGYALCFAFEHGSLSSGLPPIFTLIWTDLVQLWKMLLDVASRFRRIGLMLFRRKTDGYIAGAFLLPLLVFLVTLCSIFTAFDLAEHGGEVVQGIVRAADPNPGLPIRTRGQAISDAFAYYGISSLSQICDLLPLVILVAGLVCVYILIRNNEHLILKSSGLPLQRAFRPIVIITLVLSASVMLLRETLMPELLMHRDYLKPLVYHRTPAPSAIALYTIDSSQHPVIFEMSEYTSTTKSGKDLRIFLLNKEGRRFPFIQSDIASWNGSEWVLKTDPNKANANDRHHGADDSKTKLLPLVDHGFFIKPEAEGDADEALGEVVQVKNVKTPLASWRGTVTPAFLESEHLGTGVMRLSELSEASVIKSDFAVKWWHRISEVLMGLLLLWAAIPMLLDESRGPLTGVGYSILTAGAYWALIGLFSQTSALLPVWSPLIPHVIFVFFGRQKYYVTMPT